jgi:hypothetical protein
MPHLKIHLLHEGVNLMRKFGVSLGFGLIATFAVYGSSRSEGQLAINELYACEIVLHELIADLTKLRAAAKQAGTATRSRVVVIEFPDYCAALDCYRSPEYAAAMELRKGKAIMDLAIVEGYDGPQPTS